MLLVPRTVYNTYSVFVLFFLFCEHRVQIFINTHIQLASWVAPLYSIFSSSFFSLPGHTFALLLITRLNFAFTQITQRIIRDSFCFAIESAD